MSSVQALRDFINQRLNTAAEDIFSVFQQTIVQFEEEIVSQRRLLELAWKPHVKLHRIKLPQHHNCTEKQLFKQEMNYGQEQGEAELLQIHEEQQGPQPLRIKEEQQEPEPLRIKEEQQGPQPLRIKEEQQEPEPLRIKEEQDEPGLLLLEEDREGPEPSQTEEHEDLGTIQEGEQFILNIESNTCWVPSVEENLRKPEETPDTEQFLSNDSEIHDVKKQIDSESTRNVKLKQFSIVLGDRVDNFPSLVKQVDHEKLLCEKACGEIVRKKRHKSHQSLRTEKKICCEMCGRHQSYLLVHKRIHTTEKPYSCETCGKSFSQQSHLLHHMRTHTGEKPYSCGTCRKRFSQQGSLLHHMRTHTGEKPYSCGTCRKRFSQQGNLLHHMRTHTGEKPYSCGTCRKSFSQQGNLMVHMRTCNKMKS